MIKSKFRFLRLFFGISLRKEFVSLFCQKEGRALLGKGFSNFWFLIIIFFLTFFAIGFANGSLEYLGEKMDDPFFKWLNIKVPYLKRAESEMIINKLHSDIEAKRDFHYNNVIGYNFLTLHFFNKWNDEIIKSAYGRTFRLDDPLLEKITEDYLIRGRAFQDKNDIGLIVTEKMLVKLNYSVDDTYICMAYGDQEDRRVPLPIIAVVKELPAMTDFICTPYFFNQKEKPLATGNPFLPSDQRGISLLVFENKKSAEKLGIELQELIDTDTLLKQYKLYVAPPLSNSLFDPPCFDIKITWVKDDSMKIRDTIFQKIKQGGQLNKLDYIRYYDYSTRFTDHNITNQFHRFAVEFISLDNIDGFQTYLAERHKIDFDMAKRESRENYNFISKLTRIISIILMVFSILSICLFISNLLRNHLEKIGKNIGTFLAFGIDSHSLERIYLSIIYTVLVAAMIIGMLISWVIGSIGSIRFVLRVLGIALEENETYFSQFTWWTIILIGIMMVICFLVIKQITNTIFKQTPGDLLYDRE